MNVSMPYSAFIGTGNARTNGICICITYNFLFFVSIDLVHVRICQSVFFPLFFNPMKTFSIFGIRFIINDCNLYHFDQSSLSILSILSFCHLHLHTFQLNDDK